jgi:hypothetical protein
LPFDDPIEQVVHGACPGRRMGVGGRSRNRDCFADYEFCLCFECAGSGNIAIPDIAWGSRAMAAVAYPAVSD